MFESLGKLFLVLTLFSSIVLAQNTDSQEKEQANQKPPFKAVSVPREIVLTLVVHQPDCPLKLEVAGLQALLDGGGVEIFKFRNQGNKSIKAFKIAWLFRGGTGGSYDAKNHWLLPGATFPSDEERDSESEPFTKLVPLTDEIKKQMKMDKGMQG